MSNLKDTMKKKAKPTELSANLQPTSKDNSRSRIQSKGRIENGQPTQKKTHHKIFSMADSYYNPNIYKGLVGDKSKCRLLLISDRVEEHHAAHRHSTGEGVQRGVPD